MNNSSSNRNSSTEQKGTSTNSTKRSTDATTTSSLNDAKEEIIGLLVSNLLQHTSDLAEKGVRQARQNLPKDVESIRKLPFYDSTLSAIQWQRDNYLVGNDFANRRRLERTQEEASKDFYRRLRRLKITPAQALTLPVSVTNMPYDPTALGSIQIRNLGSSFIPSPTVKNALMPLVLDLPTGALKMPILLATVDALPTAQPLLNHAVKNSLLQFMETPEWRQIIKNRTNGYIGSPRESSSFSVEDQG